MFDKIIRLVGLMCILVFIAACSPIIGVVERTIDGDTQKAVCNYSLIEKIELLDEVVYVDGFSQEDAEYLCSLNLKISSAQEILDDADARFKTAAEQLAGIKDKEKKLRLELEKIQAQQQIIPVQAVEARAEADKAKQLAALLSENAANLEALVVDTSEKATSLLNRLSEVQLIMQQKVTATKEAENTRQAAQNTLNNFLTDKTQMRQ